MLERKPQSLSVETYGVLASGLDSLYVSFFADVITSDLDFADLAFRKERLRDRGKDAGEMLALGSERLSLRAYGRKPYTFILSNQYFEIALSENMQPTMYVRFSSKGLWSLGWRNLTDRFRAWLSSIGARETRPESISRADWAFDFRLDTADFAWEHFTSRASKDSAHRKHRAYQTFSFGRGDVVVRVYDKAAEIVEQSKKYWFYDLWERNTGVWRIEFQVRGERLKLAGLRTLRDLSERQYDLLREIATKHTRLRRPNGDRNSSRWPHHPLWKSLISEIARLPQTGLIADIKPENDLSYRAYKQTQSLIGSLKGLAAIHQLRGVNTEPVTLETLLDRLPRDLEPHHNPTDWALAIRERVEAYEAGQW